MVGKQRMEEVKNNSRKKTEIAIKRIIDNLELDRIKKRMNKKQKYSK
jgi:hypothetical protein